jgi:hypothetical protein
MPKVTMDPNDPIYARILEHKKTLFYSNYKKKFKGKSTTIHPLPNSQYTNSFNNIGHGVPPKR